MATPFAFLLLLLGALAFRPQAAKAAIIADTKYAAVGIQNKSYALPGLTGSATVFYSFNGTFGIASLPPAASGILQYSNNGTYTNAAVGTILSASQAASLIFIPAAGAAVGGVKFTFYARGTGLPNTSANADYNIYLAAADAQTSPILSNSAGQKVIPALTAGTASPNNYIIKTLPSSSAGILYVNGTAATTNQVIAPTATLTFAATTGYFGTTSFTYAPADADTTPTAGAGDVATYAIPVTTAVCGNNNNSVLDFSRRTVGEDWTNHASVAVNASNITTGNYTSNGASANSFIVDNNTALPGPSLAWRQVNTGFDPATTPNTSTVTFTFDKPVSNLSLSIQDIDQNITATQSFTDALTLDGYSTAASTTPITLAAGNFALGNTNTFSGSNTVTGTGNSNIDPASNIVVTFTSPVQRITLTFKNTAPYTSATVNRTHTMGITSMTWCRLAPIANNVTTATLPSTSVQAGISPLSSTVDGNVTTYTIVTIPNATTQGTLFYNSAGTYVAVTAGRTLTAAQANTLRYTPLDASSGNATYTYTVQDDNGQTSNTATYTIPVQNLTACTMATTTLSFGARQSTNAGEDWKSHTALAVPANSNTTISSGNYSNSAATVSTLQLGNANSASLAWNNDYSGAGRTSSVTFTFSRPVSNFTVQVQDIDATPANFIDVVTFGGANGNTNVTPLLTAVNPGAGVVSINGATATGQTSTNSATDGTVTAYFPSPILTLTITYANGTAAADPGAQRIGIDLMTWCQAAPAAVDVTSATVLSSVGATSISSLASTYDNGPVTYTLQSIPTVAQGVLSYNSSGTTYTNITAANFASLNLTAAQAASLRFAPVAGTSGNVTFTYKVKDANNQTSANTATYTIPVNNTTCAGTGTLDFSSASVTNGDDWTTHAAMAVPTGSTMTTISSGGYTTPASAATSTLNVTAANATMNINGVKTLAWFTDYANTTANTSSVTFTFNRPVSNFAMRVQDIDKSEAPASGGNAASAFADQVTFVGANGGTTVLPSLAAVGAANTVLISGNVATGTTNIANTTDGTVMAYFASPITSITLTYSNISTYLADPTTNAIGIDLLQFCRLAPVANDITNTSRLSGQSAMAINSLSATADGTVASYTITALPAASQGIYYVNNVVLNTTNFPGLVLTPTQATQLSFAPAGGFSGNAGFTYFAKDDAGVASNTANYVVPVTTTGGSGTPAACATPGKDGAPTGLTGVVNTYFAGTASVAASTSATSIPVAASVGATTGITPGDLLLVIQMQGADINFSNSNSYGANNGTGGGNLNNTNFIAGTYEYVVATSSLAANTAGSINVTKLVNSYSTVAATTTTPRQSYQVVRIPQYTSITLAGTLSALAWNGNAGGILAMDVAGTLNLNNQTLSAAAAGFRGGAGLKYTGAAGANTDYRTSSALTVNATKGEGIAGTPRYTLQSLTTAAFDNSTNTAAFASGVVNGYPSGDNGKGAPGNAGGGGTDDNPVNNGINTGGGGGANGGTGGLGGWPRINGSTINTANQAIGGVSFAPVSSSRLVMGGGGGAGSSNDGNGDTNRTGIYSSGAPGGGLILVRTGSVSGTGTANASGDGGYLLTGANGNNDGGGGGGAGGTVLITASTPAGLANLTVLATGGKGTSNSNTGDVAHGPGGGGGGGVILANGTLNAASTVAAGAAGTIASNDSYNNTTYGAAPGATGILNTQISGSIANSVAGTSCVANVATTITGPATANAGQPTGNYTVTFSNANTSGAANVTQTVALPTGAGLTAAQQATILATYPGTTFTTTGSGAAINTSINFGTTTLLSGASNSFVFAYTAATTAGTYTTTSNTSTTTNEAGQTANNTASVNTTVGVVADVTVSLSGPTTLNAGQPTGTFTATFTNEGPGAAASVARLITLPAGASLTTSQQATILAAYPNAAFSTAGGLTTIDFGSLTSLANDASSAVMFAFTAPNTTSTTLTGNTSTMSPEGNNIAPNQSTLTLSSIATADVAATITGSTSVVGGVPTGTFNVAFTNNGQQTAAGVTRTVQLPTGLTGVMVTGADAGSYNATTGLVTYTTTPTTLASGATLNSVITFPIPTTGGQVPATASVNTTTNEAGLTTNNSATAVLPAAYDLTTTISGPTTAAIAGSPVTLYVTTTNNGPSTAPSALQTVSIPSTAPLTDVYITNGGTYTYNNTTKIGTVTFPDPANTASGVTVTNLPSGQTIANSISFTAPAENFAPTATVALNSGGNGTGEINTANNTAYLNGGVAGTPVVVNTSTGMLATANESTTITTVSSIVSAGTNVTYKVAATNHGPGAAANVVEQVQLLPGLAATAFTVGGITGTGTGTITFTSGTTTVATYSSTTGILTYATLTTQASGATQNFGDIVLTVPATTGNNGQLLVTAAVRTSTNDPVPADNVSAVAVKVTSTADLATTITGPTTTTAGQTANYTVSFTNNGTGTAGNVAETMQLPAGLGTSVVVQDPTGNVLAGAYNSTTGVVTFSTVPNDAVGATQVYNVLFPAPGQNYLVSSSIGSGTTDNVGTNNTSVLATTVSPSADVSVVVSGPAATTAGNAVTYAVTTFNNGPDQANTVTPSIVLPMNLTGVTVVGGTYDAASGKVSFNAYRLASGESRVSLVTFPMPATPTNDFVTGVATVTTASNDLVASNNTAAITTSVAPATPDQADLVTSITGPSGSVAAGSPLSYTIRVSNLTASTPALNVVPTAYLPAGLTGVEVKDANGVILPNAYNSTTGQVTFPNIVSLPFGTTPAYTVSLTAPAVLSPGAGPTLITASAVSANTSDPNLANNSVGNSLSVTASFDEVTSLSGPTSALPGSTNTYTVTTTNNGPSTAPTTANTVQTVTLPAGVTVVPGSISGGGTQSGNVITFPAITAAQAAGANGAIVNTFSIVMPASGSLPLAATVTSTGESNGANNGATLTTLPTNQVPVADNVWNTLQSARGNTANQVAATGLPISPLSAIDPTVGGSIASYSITSLPDISQGILYYNGVAVTVGKPIAASGLSFAPATTFVGNATFTYTALDNGGAVSNTALYTIPVARDLAAAYITYNGTKGGANMYVTGDVLAQVADASTDTYNSAGLIYNATTGVQQSGTVNGITSATVTSGTLPAGVSLDPATGRIYVSNASQMVNNPTVQTYTVTITTVDSNGGVTTQPVSFTIGAYPLPVVLTEFTATAVANRDALLKWATASEKNNDHFDIERSFDGTSFTKIGHVAGHGTTTAA
ncbi:MAG: hypothetical protein ACRYFZ_12590 [Janthinobacterium lividum]